MSLMCTKIEFLKGFNQAFRLSNLKLMAQAPQKGLNFCNFEIKISIPGHESKIRKSLY